MKAQRDVFIQALYEKALEDKNIILISADMGAPSLDQWKFNLPDQFIAAGISEQNTINISAGLASIGKKVFVYMMASWVARCIEQVRYSCAMANNPITILGNGVGLGYAPSGPAHEPNEDIAISRALLNIEIHSPSNESATHNLVNICLEKPKLRYIRLERNYAKETHSIIYDIDEYCKILRSFENKNNISLGILSSGYLLGRTIKVAEMLDDYCSTYVVDISRIKPLDNEVLKNIFKKFSHIVTIEEQSLSGGFGSAVCEFLADNNMNKNVLRLGLPDKYIFDNGTRDYLLDNNGLSINNIFFKIKKFVNHE